MSDEMREALEAVEAEAAANERRASIEAFMHAVRTDPHAECVWPLFVLCINAQVGYDTALLELADIGSTLLACNDTE